MVRTSLRLMFGLGLIVALAVIIAASVVHVCIGDTAHAIKRPMKELIGVLAVLGIVLVGFLSGLLILDHMAPAPREFNWSQQALRDPAADGCPGQYHSYADEFLIGCWGKREGKVNDDSSDLDWVRRCIPDRLDGSCDIVNQRE